MKAITLLKNFRVIALLEGVSFIILLFIAMPLKYFANMPAAVKYVGMAHGVLFVAFIIVAFWFTEQANKNIKWLALALLASFLPFGTFVLEQKVLKKEAALLS